MLTMRNPQWYAIQTRVFYEKLCRDHLREQGIECLLPLRTRMSQWKGESKQIEWPLFPGYCFGRFSFDERKDILHAPGIVEIIGGTGTDDPIPPHEIAAIRRIMQWGRSYESYPYRLEEGIMTTVARGPLQGLHGKVVREGDTCRLIIAVARIQQAVAVTIAPEHITEAENETHLVGFIE